MYLLKNLLISSMDKPIHCGGVWTPDPVREVMLNEIIICIEISHIKESAGNTKQKCVYTV